MRRFPAVLLVALAGCSNPATPPSDMAVPDMATPQFELTGTYAGELTAQASFAGGGMGTLKIDSLAVAFYTPSSDGTTATISMDWHPCGITLPTGLSLPYAYALEPLSIAVQNGGTLSGPGDGAHFTSTTVSYGVGWCPSANGDPLPTASAPLCPMPNGSDPNVCHYATQKPCVFQTTDAQSVVHPGIPVAVTGLTPDADILYVEVQLSYALKATVMLQTLDGMTTTTTAQWNVLGCHLRAGGSCTAAQTAMLDGQKPTLTFTGGTFKAHIQPQYYSCPLFMADVGGALVTFDPLDGGVPDGGISGMSFHQIQRDLDAMGCATCHDDPDGPSRLHLVYKPWNETLVRRNYEALLPFTLPSTARGLAGGRFANGKAPVPPLMKQRWIDWAGAGAPY